MTNLTYSEQKVGIIRPSHHGDCLIVGHNLREREAMEIWGYDNSLPVEGVTNSFNKSIVSMTIEHHGVPVAMFGIMILKEIPTLWLMPTDDLKIIGRNFVRNTREWINKMLVDYPRLTAYVDLHNTESLKWMDYVGGEHAGVFYMGKDGMPFRRFVFERNVCKN